MKVIVTGGAGRLGPYVIRELIGHGHDVLCIDAVKPAESLCRSSVIDLGAIKDLRAALAGADALVHLARRRFPYTENGYDAANESWKSADIAGDAERFGHNVAMTNNALTAGWESGVKKIVCGSSLAVYGLYYPARRKLPDYLPVDEPHPRRPEDPYGLSKLIGEELCDGFARKGDMRIASLRFAGIVTEAQLPILRQRRNEPLCRGIGALWSYIDVRDAAVACRLALEADFSGHEAFNVCAPETYMDGPTAELMQEYLSEVAQIEKSSTSGNWSGYDTRKAEAMLGFRARQLLKNAALQ
jgi:nucleoside-diphosphate-sugar epimerase